MPFIRMARTEDDSQSAGQSARTGPTSSGWSHDGEASCNPKMPRRRYTGPVPTLAQLRSSSCCGSAAPSVAAIILRLGRTHHSLSGRKRTPRQTCYASARCSRFGHLGASLRHPSWSGDVYCGASPFPVERLAAAPTGGYAFEFVVGRPSLRIRRP